MKYMKYSGAKAGTCLIKIQNTHAQKYKIHEIHYKKTKKIQRSKGRDMSDKNIVHTHKYEIKWNNGGRRETLVHAYTSVNLPSQAAVIGIKTVCNPN